MSLPTGADLIAAFKATGLVPDAFSYSDTRFGQRCACAVGVLAIAAHNWKWAKANRGELHEKVGEALGISQSTLWEFEGGVLAYRGADSELPERLFGQVAWREVMAAVERGELPARVTT